MAVVIRRFEFSTATTYTIEAGAFYFRFAANRQQILLSGSPYEIPTPYAGDDVRAVQWKQVNDIVYLTHPDYPVYRLTRLADTDWELAIVAFDNPPFLDENLTDVTIASSGSLTAGSSVTLLATADLFVEAHIGSYWRIGHKVPGDFVSLNISGNGSSSSIPIYGAWEVHTYRNWGATITVQRSIDGGSTWEDVIQKESRIQAAGGQGSSNFDFTGTADQFALYRVTITGYDANSEAGSYVRLDRPEAVVYGYVQITAVGSGQSATAEVIDELFANTATLLWSEGAWSDVRGYPRACTIHEGRLVFGGTDYEPLTIRGSKVDDFEDFTRGTADNDAYVWPLAATGQATVNWLASREALLVGTSQGNWRVRGDGFGNPITPTRVDAKKRDNEGSEYIPAEECGEPIAYVARKGAKIVAVTYDESSDNIVTEDLTLLAEHITNSGVVEMAWQEDKRILWCVRNDGLLVGLTYDRRQEVAGWHVHETQGYFRSVTTIFGDSDAEDEVWLLVERTLGSEQVFHVELLDPDFWTEKEDYFGVDAGLTYEGSPATHFSGLSHLAGLDIMGLADGRVFAATVDVYGEFDLPSGFDPASTVHAGLPFTHELSPFRLDADAVAGVHITRTKRIDHVAMRVSKTVGGVYYIDAETFPIEPPPTREGDDPDNPPLLGSTRPEDVPLKGFQQDHTRDPNIRIVGSDPLPMSVLGLAVGYSVGEG